MSAILIFTVRTMPEGEGMELATDDGQQSCYPVAAPDHGKLEGPNTAENDSEGYGGFIGTLEPEEEVRRLRGLGSRSQLVERIVADFESPQI